MANPTTYGSQDYGTGTDQANRSADYEAIRQDIQGLRDQVTSLIGHVRSGAAGAVSDLRSQGDERMQALSDRVEERPVQSVLIAFAIGFVTSRLLFR